MKYFRCEHCHKTNQVEKKFSLIKKCSHCDRALTQVILYNNEEDVKHTNSDSKFELLFYKKIAIGVPLIILLHQLYQFLVK